MALSIPVSEIVEKNEKGLLSKDKKWSRLEVNNFAEILNGFAFKSQNFTGENDGTPIIRIRDIHKTKSDTNYIGDYDSDYLVNKGDILIGMDGDFELDEWKGKTSLLNQRVCKITIDENKYNKKFFRYVMPGYLQEINNKTSSVTVKHLSSRTITETPLPNPPLPLQQKIVSAIETQFSRLDEVVENLRSVKKKLGVYRKAVLKKGFEKGEETELGKVFEIVMGQSPPSEFYNKDGKGLPFFQGKKEFELKYPRIENWTTKYNKKANKGDLLVSIRAPIGPCNIAPEKCVIGRGIAAIRASNEIESLFAFYLIKYNGQKLDSKGTGTTFKAISKTSLNSFVTNIPDKKDWKKIVSNIEAKFSVVDEVELVVERALVGAERLRKAILKVAFEGRLV